MRRRRARRFLRSAATERDRDLPVVSAVPADVSGNGTVVPQNNNFFGALYTNDASLPHGYNAWYAQFLGAASNSGQVLTFQNPSSPPLTFTANDYYVYALYEVPT